jgi:hypothetical protein
VQEPLDSTEEGQRSYQKWRDKLQADPEFRKIYEEEAAKKELWLQLVEARQKAGVAHAEVARRLGISLKKVVLMERCGYDAYTLNDLRQYAQALVEEFSLDVSVR